MLEESKKPVYVVIDSNFIHGQIKLNSPDFGYLLKNTNYLKWTVIFPQGVILELYEGAKEKYIEAKNSLDSAVSNAERVNVQMKSFEIMNQKEHLKNYSENLDKIISENNIIIIPFPKEIPSIESMFSTAVEKKLPFDSRGDSFRDVIIWYSIEEFVKSNAGMYYVLTKDGNLRKTVEAFGAPKIEAVNFEQLKKIIVLNLDQNEKVRRKAISDKIDKYLQDKGLLKGVVVTTIKNEQNFIIEPTIGHLVSVDDFNYSDKTPIELVSESNRQVNFYFHLEGFVSYTVMIYQHDLTMRGKAVDQMLKNVIGYKIGAREEISFPYDNDSVLVSPGETMPEYHSQDKPVKFMVAGNCLLDSENNIQDLKIMNIVRIMESGEEQRRNSIYKNEI